MHHFHTAPISLDWLYTVLCSRPSRSKDCLCSLISATMGLLKVFNSKTATPVPPMPTGLQLEKISSPLQNGARPEIRMTRRSMAPSTQPTTAVANLKFEIMANFLSQEQSKRKWVRDFESNREATFIRRGQADYVTYPPTLGDSGSELSNAISALNPQVSVLDHDLSPHS